jgi:tetratricopeptide (TPR) repeat protein
MRKVKLYIAIIGLSVWSLETLGNNNTDYINQGKNHLSELDIENAIQAFSEAIEKKHNEVDAYLHRAKAYLISGNCEKAAEDYSRAYELDPEYVEKKLNIESYKQSGHSTVYEFTDTKYYE